MTTVRVPEPDLPEGVTPGELDAEARRDLRGLQKDTAETVARHLVAAGMLVDEDPQRALEHARFARRRASRIAVVREAAGIAAYHAGEWNEALGELRAARRMGGGPGHLAVMADIERAMGRPERALELVRSPEARELGRAETIELAIVAAGARRDLGELDAAVVGLQIPELDPSRREPWSPRLFYAYADNLLAAGRESDALQWFVHAVDADELGETDAAERIAELTGEPIDDSGVEFQGEVEVEPGSSDEDEGGGGADQPPADVLAELTGAVAAPEAAPDGGQAVAPDGGLAVAPDGDVAAAPDGDDAVTPEGGPAAAPDDDHAVARHGDVAAEPDGVEVLPEDPAVPALADGAPAEVEGDEPARVVVVGVEEEPER